MDIKSHKIDFEATIKACDLNEKSYEEYME